MGRLENLFEKMFRESQTDAPIDSPYFETVIEPEYAKSQILEIYRLTGIPHENFVFSSGSKIGNTKEPIMIDGEEYSWREVYESWRDHYDIFIRCGGRDKELWDNKEG